MALVNTWIVTLRGRRGTYGTGLALVTLLGRRGTYGTGLALVARLVPRPRWDAAAFCMAGVALCDIDLHFVWQAWHLMTWIVTLRGRRAMMSPSLCVAGVVLEARKANIVRISDRSVLPDLCRWAEIGSARKAAL